MDGRFTLLWLLQGVIKPLYTHTRIPSSASNLLKHTWSMCSVLQCEVHTNQSHALL